MINPIITARRALGMNRQALANQANMAITSVEYLESGAYGDIPERIQALLEISDPYIITHYEQWKVQERIKQNQVQRFIDGTFPELMDMMHPHEEWRQSVNGLGLNTYCGAIKIQRNVVQNVESGRQAKYPKMLHITLVQACGIEVAERIRLASDAYVQFKNNQGPNPIAV